MHVRGSNLTNVCAIQLNVLHVGIVTVYAHVNVKPAEPPA